jgi:hypothetical protein
VNPTEYFDEFAKRYTRYKGGSWCYEDGCVYRGLIHLFEATGDARWKAHLHRLADPQIGADGALLGYDPREYNIDHVFAGRSLFALAEGAKIPVIVWRRTVWPGNWKATPAFPPATTGTRSVIRIKCGWMGSTWGCPSRSNMQNPPAAPA